MAVRTSRQRKNEICIRLRREIKEIRARKVRMLEEREILVNERAKWEEILGETCNEIDLHLCCTNSVVLTDFLS